MEAQVRELLLKQYPGTPKDIAIIRNDYAPALQDIQNQMPAGVTVVADFGINFEDERLFEGKLGECYYGATFERTSFTVTAEGSLLKLYYGDCGIEIVHSEPLTKG